MGFMEIRALIRHVATHVSIIEEFSQNCQNYVVEVSKRQHLKVKPAKASPTDASLRRKIEGSGWSTPQYLSRNTHRVGEVRDPIYSVVSDINNFSLVVKSLKGSSSLNEYLLDLTTFAITFIDELILDSSQSQHKQCDFNSAQETLVIGRTSSARMSASSSTNLSIIEEKERQITNLLSTKNCASCLQTLTFKSAPI